MRMGKFFGAICATGLAVMALIGSASAATVHTISGTTTGCNVASYCGLNFSLKFEVDTGVSGVSLPITGIAYKNVFVNASLTLDGHSVALPNGDWYVDSSSIGSDQFGFTPVSPIAIGTSGLYLSTLGANSHGVFDGTVPVDDLLTIASFDIFDTLSFGLAAYDSAENFIAMSANDWVMTTTPSAVPLPAALPLYGAGMALLGFFGWRKKRGGLRFASA